MYIVIGGGGMVGGVLARQLLENKHDVVLIDESRKICDKLHAETGVIAINGSVARIEVLAEAGIKKADVVIAATPNDADNLACTILAKSFGVPRIVVRMRDPAYEHAYRIAGVSTIVRVLDLMVNQIITDIENPNVRRIMTISGGRANIFVVVVPENAKVAGKTIKEITANRKFPSHCSFTAVYNPQKEDFTIPRGNQVINSGDEVFLTSKAADISKGAGLLTATK